MNIKLNKNVNAYKIFANEYNNRIYNYGLHEKLISIIIKLRKGYFPEVRRTEGK